MVDDERLGCEASPVLQAAMIAGYDRMPDDVRQRFSGYLHRLPNSRSEAHEAARLRIMWLAAVRAFAPAALDAAGLHAHAAQLRALPDDVEASVAEAAAKAAARAAAQAGPVAAVVTVSVAASAYAEDASERAVAAVAKAAVAATSEVAWTARAKAGPAWDAWFAMLDEAFNAGPQGTEPWSAVQIEAGAAAYVRAGRLVDLAEVDA